MLKNLDEIVRQKQIGDLLTKESISLNEHYRWHKRMLQYRPDGKNESFVSILMQESAASTYLCFVIGTINKNSLHYMK